jgi:hypothetical protein
MQLYAAEVTGLTYEKLSPRISDTAKLMWTTYIVLTAIEILALWLCGMELFDFDCGYEVWGSMIVVIEWLIKKGYFPKEYLEE